MFAYNDQKDALQKNKKEVISWFRRGRRSSSRPGDRGGTSGTASGSARGDPEAVLPQLRRLAHGQPKQRADAPGPPHTRGGRRGRHRAAPAEKVLRVRVPAIGGGHVEAQGREAWRDQQAKGRRSWGQQELGTVRAAAGEEEEAQRSS